MFCKINFFPAYRFIAVVLIFSIGNLLAPTPAKAAMLQEFDQQLSDSWCWLALELEGVRGGSDGERERKGVRPSPAPSKEERETQVATLELNPNIEVALQSRQPLVFTAIPLDRQGKTIHGLRPTWESSDNQVIFIRPNGEAMAGNPGVATVTARAGSKRSSIRVTVSKGTRERFAVRKRLTRLEFRRQLHKLTVRSLLTR